MWSLTIQWKPVCFLLSWSERALLECTQIGNVLQASQPEISGCDLFLHGDKWWLFRKSYTIWTSPVFWSAFHWSGMICLDRVFWTFLFLLFLRLRESSLSVQPVLCFEPLFKAYFCWEVTADTCKSLLEEGRWHSAGSCGGGCLPTVTHLVSVLRCVLPERWGWSSEAEPGCGCGGSARVRGYFAMALVMGKHQIHEITGEKSVSAWKLQACKKNDVII